MSFSIEKLPNEPIVICILESDYNQQVDYEAFLAELGRLLEGEPGPIYRITQTFATTIIFADLVAALAEETRNGKPGTMSDPRIKPIMVSTASNAQFPIDSAKQAQYGNFNVPLFTTLDEALAYAREQQKN